MARLFLKYIFIFLLFCHFNILLAQNSPSYDDLIASADKYFAKKDYYNAKTTFQLALQIDKNAEYPKKKIAEIIQILNDELELRIIFEEKIKYAEEAYADKDYQKAIRLYQEAAAIIDYEEKPKQEIVRIEKEWEDLRTRQSKYDRLLADAQEDKQVRDFVSAILKLEEADKLLPGKSEVLNELALLNLLFKQQNSRLVEFNRLVSEADNRMEQNRFQMALKSYQEAAALFENDSHVKTQLILVKEAIKIDEAYNNAIEKADAHYIALELEDAKKAYKEALKMWPEKTYPGNMLTKLDEADQRFADDLERLNNAYEAKIASADIQFNNQKYEQAYDMYIKALDLKPEEEYPQNQILAIDVIIKRNKEFNELVENGDLKYAQGKLNDALFDYYKAKNLRPKEKYPQEKITEIDVILAGQEADEKKYQNQLQIANSLFEIKSWEEAITQYLKVIALKANEQFPIKRLAEAKQLLSTQNELIASYQAAIEKGDAFFESQSFPEARTAYLEANRIKPDEPYPLYKIEDINTIVEQKDIRKTNTRYNELVLSADKFFDDKAYKISLTQYRQASALKPNEVYPPLQIAKIDQILAAQEELDNKYNKFIKSADSSFYLEEFSIARKIYVQAKELKPIEEYPPNQIDKIDALLDELNTLEQNYQAAISRADISFEEIKYSTAKVYYSLALTYKPLESYPKQRIEEIDALLAQMNALEADYQKAIQEGDWNFEVKNYLMALSNFKAALKIKVNEVYPKIKIADIESILAELDQIDKSYNQALAEADNFYDEKKYFDTLPFYEKAERLKPQEEYPPQQIAKINQILAAQNAIDAKYNRFIKSADSAFYLEELIMAREVYVSAKEIKPLEEYPPAQISKIDALLAELKDIEQNYQAAIARADVSFAEIKYNSAKEDYSLALTYKPLENYPKQRIAEIDVLLAQMNAMEAAYRKAIQDGDRNFEVKNYLLALSNFKEALKIKANEEYPKIKIAAIESILAKLNQLEKSYNQALVEADKFYGEVKYIDALPFYKTAQSLKPDETYPPQQIAKIDQIIAVQNELDAKYNRFIKSADSAFYLEEFSIARKIYVQAIELKPNEEYPPFQINKIDAILAELKAIEQNYQDAIARADEGFDKIKYNSAKEDYNLALTYKPLEDYPKQRLAEIDALLAQLKAMEEAYLKAIQEGDRNFEVKKYLLALSNFKEALKIKVNEEYPKTKIAAIESILSELDQLELYDQALTEADYFYEKKQYSAALPFYEKAQSVKPEETYPPDQIAKIKDLLEASDREYQAFIKQGDEAYRRVIFQDAIVAYENALGIYPNEAYPRMMLDKIDAQIRRESVVSLVTTYEIIEAGREKRYAFKPIEYRDRQNNYILIEMKNAKAGHLRVFINFGQDGVKNGGYSVNLVQRDGFTKYFVRIDRHLRWQNFDNNWISLLPEGSDLDVNLIRISRDEKSN